MFRTKIGVKYRWGYMPGKAVPAGTIKTMRAEISKMRRDLIRKQEALGRSKKYSQDESLYRSLKELSLRDIHTPKQTMQKWRQLMDLEEDRRTSISGKREQEKQTIESLHAAGYDFVNEQNIAKFGEFMNYIKDNYPVYYGQAAAFFEAHKEESEGGLEYAFDRFIAERSG